MAEQIKDNILKMMVAELIARLEEGRRLNELPPLTAVELVLVATNYTTQLKQAADNMYHAYEADELQHLEPDWCREFLYELIPINVDEPFRVEELALQLW